MYILCVEIAFSNNLRNQSALYRIACENESFLLDVSFCLHICQEEPGGRAVAEQDHGQLTDLCGGCCSAEPAPELGGSKASAAGSCGAAAGTQSWNLLATSWSVGWKW